MVWTLLTGALGGLGITLLLWRKARVEKELAVTKLLLKGEQALSAEAHKAVIDNANFYAEQEARREAVIAQLRKEIEAMNEVLEKLPTGALRNGLLLSLGIKPSDTDLIDPTKL